MNLEGMPAVDAVAQHQGDERFACGRALGVKNMNLLFRAALQHHLPANAGGVIAAGQLAGERHHKALLAFFHQRGVFIRRGAGCGGSVFIRLHVRDELFCVDALVVHIVDAPHVDLQACDRHAQQVAQRGGKVAAAVYNDLDIHSCSPSTLTIYTILTFTGQKVN